MNQWIDVKHKLPESKFNKYVVKLENGEEKIAFFMPDKIDWIGWYGQKTTYWMESFSGELIHNVTHWREK